VRGQCAHAFDVGGDVDRADDGPQVARHRLLQRQQSERGLLDLPTHGHDVLLVGDDVFGYGQLGVE
jgi:hypothetical protein